LLFLADVQAQWCRRNNKNRKGGHLKTKRTDPEQGMKKSVGIGVAAAVLAAAGLSYWLLAGDSRSGDSPAVAGSAGSGGMTGVPGAHVAPSSFVTGTEGLPNSLQGTEVDGELEVDANGHLKITNGVRHVFDYFLSAIGEEPLETILARIRAYIRHKLPNMAAGEAEQLLDNYIAYKRGLAISTSMPCASRCSRYRRCAPSISTRK
jgi:hypothetical protein